MRLDNAHVTEIESVLAGEYSDRDDVVIESWKRCIGEHRLDPAQPTKAYVVPDYQLREHRERSERLVGIARASVEDLFRQLAGQNYVLLLSDEVGVTVDFFGDDTFKRQLTNAGLHLGFDWAEERSGTSGVGSCIATGEALTVHQSDHFDNTHTPLSCTAAPIFDTQGVMSAVLDISLLRSPSPKISQNLALHLVTTSAKRIEHAGLLSDMRNEWVLCFARSPALLDVDPEATVAFDGSGRVIGMTHSGARLLASIRDCSWRDTQSLLGSQLGGYFHASVDDLPRFTRFYPANQRRIVALDNSVWYVQAIDPAVQTVSSFKPQTRTKKPTQSPTLPPALAALSGGDQALDGLLDRVAKLAKVKLPMLIQGETGSGKEYMAKAIHQVARFDKPFVAINCAAIPASLIEGELFGHAAGAYTGASRHGRAGLIESADGGTLFLDEIGDMPLELQARLLRFLSEGEIMRVGAVELRRVDVRVLAASLHTLPKLVAEGRFRSDLYFRLNGVELQLPALRNRSDLRFLVHKILQKHAHNGGICDDAMQGLSRYDWPGNLRELDNVLQLAIAMCEGQRISVRDLPSKVVLPFTAPSTHTVAELTNHEAVDSASAAEKHDLAAMLSAIDMANGNMSRAAKSLSIDRSTLYRRLKRLQS